MRILIDENLPVSLIEALRLLGHDVEHVETRSLSGHDDPDVLALAEREGRFLIMQDVDFADLRSFVAGVHPGLLLVRLKHPAPGDVRAAVLATFCSTPATRFYRSSSPKNPWHGWTSILVAR